MSDTPFALMPVASAVLAEAAAQRVPRDFNGRRLAVSASISILPRNMDGRLKSA